MPSLFSKIVFILIVCFAFSVESYSQKLKTYEDSIKYDRKRVEFEKMFVQANLEKNRKNYDQALALYFDCNKLLGDNDAVYYEIAQIYFAQEKYNEAKEMCVKAQKISPNNVEYKRFLDNLYIKMGKKR